MTLESKTGPTTAVACRVCGDSRTQQVLDLGEVPLANAFVDPALDGKDEPTFPLGIQFCPTCAIVQIPVTVDPDLLFRHYLYTPSASSTWRQHCAELSAWIQQQVGGTDLFVVEPASNDGCLLREVGTWAPRILGVEPARNIAEQAVRDGIPTITEFFGTDTAGSIRRTHGPAHVVVGTNVLAHVPDVLDFVRGAASLLRPDGFFVVEAPYLRDLVESVAYDTIYHEHVSYLSVTALDRIYRLAGLALTHVERVSTHGGSIRFVGRPAGTEPDESVAVFLAEEQDLGYADGRALLDFAGRVSGLISRFAELVQEASDGGSALAAYGATAKGNTLLTTSGIDASLLRYVVDRNPLKQGLLTPGTHVPVVGPERLREEPVDVLLILAWNIADEIVTQESWFSDRGGRFLVPIPEPTFVP